MSSEHATRLGSIAPLLIKYSSDRQFVVFLNILTLFSLRSFCVHAYMLRTVSHMHTHTHAHVESRLCFLEGGIFMCCVCVCVCVYAGLI